MTHPDIISQLKPLVPELRGRLEANVPLNTITWFRVGGPAQVLYTPADAQDLAFFLGHIPADIPVTVLGLGSNTIVRDGGIEGVVIRLGGKGFNHVHADAETCIVSAGAGVPDVKVASAAADASLAGLQFFRGIPGGIGGAVRMNAGAYGRETKDALIDCTVVRRNGDVHRLTNAELGFVYRNSALPEDAIVVSARFQAEHGDQAQIRAEMDEITKKRETTQPVKSKTGGSTFKNPEGHKSWQLIDAAGLRGFRVGGAHMSELHCNFLINDENATAADIETLGETVRQRVFEHSGVMLEWEIKRVGVA